MLTGQVFQCLFSSGKLFNVKIEEAVKLISFSECTRLDILLKKVLCNSVLKQSRNFIGNNTQNFIVSLSNQILHTVRQKEL